MKAIFRILTLTVVATLFAGSTLADTNFIIYGQSYLGLSYSSSETMTQSGSSYTYSFTATATGNNQSFKIYKNSLSDDNALCCQTQALQFETTYDCVVKKSDTSYKNELNMSVIQGVSYAITVNYTDDNDCTISIAQTSTTLTVYAVANPTAGGTCDKASGQCIEGGSVVFTVTPNGGYEYSSYTFGGVESSSSVVRDGNTFTVSPTADGQTLSVTFTAQQLTVTPSFYSDECSVSPNTAQTVSYNGSQSFNVTPGSGYYLDKGNTNFSGKANLEFSGNTINLTNITEGGTLTIVCATSQTPVVYWAQYPEVGINAISLYGYLGERYCLEVTKAGFYWSTSEIDDDDVIEIVNGSTTPDNLIPTSTEPLSGFKNGTNFLGSVDQNNETFAAITDPTVIYLVNYVKTSGGVGISDHVAVYYKPCKGISSVSINPDEVSVPKDSSYVLVAIPREAGKHPTYAWTIADASVGENNAEYKYVMTSLEDDVTIKVTVTDEECQVSKYAEAIVSPCDAPSMTSLEASKATPSPWEVVTLTVNELANAGDVEWSVSPSAELYDTSISGASFKGSVQSGESTVYTITATAVGNDCGDNVLRKSFTTKITVVKDQEDCTSQD